MHLHGKEMVSLATQRSARQLVGTSLLVVLAKWYQQPLDGLNVFGVPIDPSVIAGAAVAVVIFQSLTFGLHWLGDLFSLPSWNSAEKLNGMSRYSAGAPVLNVLEELSEKLDTVVNSARGLQGQAGQAAIEEVAVQVAKATVAIDRLRPSVRRFGLYGNFYFFGLYFVLPLIVTAAALLLPSPNA